ncbi:MAG: hypothetical protein ACOZE5_12310 [Verrucomicrobiota bacterium]
MSHLAVYFAKRRARLRRKNLCTRCGAVRAKAGFTLCADCMAVTSLKRAPLPSEAEKKAKDEKIKRLHAKLDLINEARRAGQQEIDRLVD